MKGAANPGQQEKKKLKQVEEWGDDDNEDEDEPVFEEVLIFFFFIFSLQLFKKGAPDIDLPEFLKGGALRAKQVWDRPEVPSEIKKSEQALVFQTMEVDYTHGNYVHGMPGNTVGLVPILRVYGVTGEGHSVLCNVHGFLPYLWVPAPANFKPQDVEVVRKTLNGRMEGANVPQALRCSEYILSVELHNKRSIMNYQGDNELPFLKITCALPKHIPTLRRILEGSVNIPGYGERAFLTYESNILFVMRFMVDTGIVGGGWVELPKSTYHSVPTPTSHCQIEVNVAYNKLKAFTIDEKSDLAPLRILSFDIECAGRKGVFPEPKHDPVIMIACYVTRQGESTPFIRNLFTLRGCSNILGAEVFSFDTEQDMLSAFRAFVIQCDPDVLTGYNINNFDLPYLIHRAEFLKLQSFLFLGRVKNVKSKVRDAKFSSKAYGTRESHETNIDGRVSFDVLQILQRDHKLRSYGLNAVSAHFLGEQKEEVHFSIIGDLYNGTDDDRRRLGIYCLKDAYLPQRLLDRLMCVVNYIEMARVTGVPFSFLLARGQQVKVISQLFRAAMPKGIVIPAYKVSGNAGEVSYTGAVVIEPIKGFYEVPIATLDFASLYPSIMQAHNLCYSTLINKNSIERLGLSEEDYVATPNGHYFVKTHVRKGLLPEILDSLLQQRAKAKLDLKNEQDPAKKAVLDGRQLALKISANSVYGFTGATVGKLPCLEISAAVTAFGRDMLHATRDLVEKTYTVANGYPADAVVVYGDTDSVMVKFGYPGVAETMELGREAAKFVSNTFKKPIRLEFEKVYFPYLLISKKRYAGLFWTRPEKYDKMDTKGIETVRRDNCPLVKDVITTCLQKILIDRDIEGAVSYTQDTISDLLCNRLDISKLVITKAFSKKGEEYVGKQAHVVLAEKMYQRDPATAPVVGDRVPFVIVKGAKDAKAYERAEDPLYVLENNIPLDSQYYLNNQLNKPLTRIFKPVLPNLSVLFSGEHTRSIAMVVPKKGGIVGFTKKRLQCLQCKV